MDETGVMTIKALEKILAPKELWQIGAINSEGHKTHTCSYSPNLYMNCALKPSNFMFVIFVTVYQASTANVTTNPL